MSVSDYPTMAASHGNDGVSQQLNGHAYSVGDASEKSPYANAQFISLHVGPEATRFYVHDSVLSQSEVLASRSKVPAPKFGSRGFAQQSVPLPELDEATAHTMVHFLYTGNYQALKVDANFDKIVPQSYMLGTCAYCAAARYKLPGLVELAKEKIVSLGEDVSIFDVLSVARDHGFPLLPEDDTWYSAYVEGALNSAMAEDPEPFRKPDFITQVEGNSKLLQVVWKTVMSNYAQTSTKSAAKDDEIATPTVETNLEPYEPASAEDYGTAANTQNVSHGDLDTINEPATVPATSTTTMDSSTDDVAASSETTQEESIEFDDIQPMMKRPAAPESFTDELDYGSSKTYQQMGKKSAQTTATDAPSNASEKPLHARSDSVMQFEEPELKPSDTTDVVCDSEQLPHEVNDAAPSSKKNKKQKKKKSSIVFH